MDPDRRPLTQRAPSNISAGWTWADGVRAPVAAKFAIALVLDLIDFTIGRAPILGVGMDALAAGVAVLLWGWKGLFALWELADPTEQIDGFAPTQTLIALASLRRRAGDDTGGAPSESQKAR